jgi:hypothetical protein
MWWIASADIEFLIDPAGSIEERTSGGPGIRFARAGLRGRLRFWLRRRLTGFAAGDRCAAPTPITTTMTTTCRPVAANAHWAELRLGKGGLVRICR